MALSDEDITKTDHPGTPTGDDSDDADRDPYHRSAEGPNDGGADPHGTDGGADGGAH